MLRILGETRCPTRPDTRPTYLLVGLRARPVGQISHCLSFAVLQYPTGIHRRIGILLSYIHANSAREKVDSNVYVGLITSGSGFGSAARPQQGTMPARPSVPRLLCGTPTPLTCSVLYVFLYTTFLVLNLHWTSRGIAQPEAFCAGTTAAYRKGNGHDSALTPFTTLHPSMRATCARLGAQASTRATAPISATAPTGPRCRRMLRRLACIAQSCSP